MDSNSDFDLEEMRDIAEGMGRKGKNKDAGARRLPLTAVLAGVCLVLVLALFYTCGDQEPAQSMGEISDRLNQLEKKVVQLEEALAGVGQLESQVQTLRKTVLAMEDNALSLSKEFGRMDKQIGLIKGELAGLNQKIGERVRVQGEGVSQAKKKVHEVKKGDTLYGIAKQYGVSVDELRRLNHFSKHETIFPGQMIVVR